METSAENQPTGPFKGEVYGDLVGSPYMIENTYNRYFDLGESRRAYSRGRVRSFFPEVTEVSHGSAAVSHWLSKYRDSPTAENLQKCLRDQFNRHPKGGWTEPTRLFLTSGNGSPSGTPDWSAVTRSLPIAAFCGKDLFRALELTEACVHATCTDEDTVRAAQAVTHSIFMAREGRLAAEIFTVLEMQYGLRLTLPEDDLRAMLRGEVAEPVMMLGVPVEGAYRFRLPESPAPPSSRLVTEAALRSVIRSDSWEDAVRRAVALGGPSNAVAGIAGGVAEALYGEVTPSVVGKLFTYIPTDVYRQIESFEKATSVNVERQASPYHNIGRDSVMIISLGPGKTTYVVPEDRKDIRRVIEGSFPHPDIITPDETAAFLSKYSENRSGTYPYGPRPETRTLYVQDGQRLVSPSQYVAAGMPSLQERRRHLSEFLSLRAWCVDAQKEMNRLAGNPDAGQIHYGNAYHMWIGGRQIDFYFGDTLAGRISLDGRGLLKVDLGEYRDLSADARFEDHREQAWASRSLFTVAETVDPLSHMNDIRNDIRARLLDEGLGTGTDAELDARYLNEDERHDRSPVSNIDHLEPLAPDSGKGIAADLSDRPSNLEVPVTGKSQSVDTVYSIGYGLRSQEGFINTLEMLGVDTVIDVRSIPRSRYAPQFDEGAIYEALRQRDIDYYTAGEKLGARPEDATLHDSEGRVDWERLRESAPYKEGIQSIRDMAADGHVTALVCSEGDPLSCHRFGTVSRDLSEAGMDVRHVLTNGEVVSHQEMEDRLLERYTRKNLITSTLTGTYKEQMDEAYRVMNRERGYRPQRSRGRRGAFVKVKL